MRDAGDNVLYVGKAKNLQQRLRNYRVANPDRMPRRHLRMVSQVSRIEFQFCPSESAALKTEARLIRSLRPKFNRAGVWPGKPKFIVWRVTGDSLESRVVETPTVGWQRFGPLGSSAMVLHQTIARLVWLAVNPARTIGNLPVGWARGERMEQTSIRCGTAISGVNEALEAYFWNDGSVLLQWLSERFSFRVTPFERRVIETEMETLRCFTAKQARREGNKQQLALL